MTTIAEPSPHKVGRDPPGARSERDVRRAREARIKYWRVLIVTAFFVVVLGGNLFVGGVLVIKALHSATAETAASVRIGRMTFPLLDGVFCRHVLIDNETVETKEEKVSRCDGQDPISGRSGNGFSWGK
jgi:hypothetical protein